MNAIQRLKESMKKRSLTRARRRAVNAAWAELKKLKKGKEINLPDEYFFKAACAGLHEVMGFIPGMYIKEVAAMGDGQRRYLALAVKTATEETYNAKRSGHSPRTEETGSLRCQQKNSRPDQKSHKTAH